MRWRKMRRKASRRSWKSARRVGPESSRDFFLSMIQLETAPSDAGQRLDLYLHTRLPEYSRARLQEWIRSGRVRIDGTMQKRSYLLRGTERIEVQPAEPAPLRATA